MAEADQKALLNIFQEARLKVPRYQRSYAWDEKQVIDLLDDIDYVIKRKKDVGTTRDVVHYFGTIVLDEVREIESPAVNNWTLYDIVDGQQRLTTISMIVGCVCEEVDRLGGNLSVTSRSQNEPGALYKEHRNIYVKYRNKDGGRRLEPATLTEDAYKKLVVYERDPADIRSENHIVLPARKLADAKEKTQQRLKSKRREFLDGDDIESADQEALQEYYSYLNDVLSAISNTFEVTRYEVDNAAEAGRLFEVVNDRGKDLTTAEKIKSHLLYCAGEVDGLDPEEVASDFNEAVETITLSGGDEDIVDQFVERHWEMFTGETSRTRPQQDINEIHRRIKQIGRYAPLSRDENELTRWIKTYVGSLLDTSSSFVAIYDPDELASAYSDLPGPLLDRLYSIENSGAATNFRPLLMASLQKNGAKSSEFQDLVRISEVFAFRAYQVVGRTTTLLRRELKQEAHRLFVSDRDESYLTDLFNTVPLDNYYHNPKHAAESIAQLIDQRIGDRAPEADFVSKLKNSDVIEGKGTTGWGGFNSKSTIMYLLYEYERKLRNNEGETNLHTLVRYSKFDSDAQLEHIAPKNPDGAGNELDNHKDNRNKVANMAFLWPEDNQKGSNYSYKYKYENIYESSGVKVLQELPEPSTGWDLDSLSLRESKLTDFCLERWSGYTITYVSVDERLSDNEKEEIRSDVVDHLKNQRKFNVNSTSRVVITEENPANDGETVAKRECGRCGSIRMKGIHDGKYTCVCNKWMSNPPYQVISELSDNSKRE